MKLILMTQPLPCYFQQQIYRKWDSKSDSWSGRQTCWHHFTTTTAIHFIFIKLKSFYGLAIHIKKSYYGLATLLSIHPSILPPLSLSFESFSLEPLRHFERPTTTTTTTKMQTLSLNLNWFSRWMTLQTKNNFPPKAATAVVGGLVNINKL